MATAIPDHIARLDGLARQRGIHEWRLNVHRRRRIKGVIATAIALTAFTVVVLTIAAITALVAAASVAAAAGGGSLVYACMQGHKVTYHRERLAELTA
ncbi:MAG TPA: hypothetical protein VF696_01250 [Candidatus Paceibacterota bacterium]|jgi:hypothetical protein